MAEKLAYNIEEAAEACGVSESTIWREVRAGLLVTCKIRGTTVIRRGRILAYLRKREQEALRLSGRPAAA